MEIRKKYYFQENFVYKLSWDTALPRICCEWYLLSLKVSQTKERAGCLPGWVIWLSFVRQSADWETVNSKVAYFSREIKTFKKDWLLIEIWDRYCRITEAYTSLDQRFKNFRKRYVKSNWYAIKFQRFWKATPFF